MKNVVFWDSQIQRCPLHHNTKYFPLAKTQHDRQNRTYTKCLFRFKECYLTAEIVFMVVERISDGRIILYFWLYFSIANEAL